MYKTFHKSISTFAKLFGMSLDPLLKRWTDIYLHRKKFRGNKDAVKFMKELNVVSERYALYQPITPIPWTKSSRKTGLPRILKPFKRYLRHRNPIYVVITLSVLRSVEDLHVEISKDLSTIIEPSTADPSVVESIIQFIPRFVRRLKPLRFTRMKWNYTTKKGPNGPALENSDLDYSVLMNSDTNLLASVKTVVNNFSFAIKGHLGLVERRNTPVREGSYHSLLTQFSEKAGKTRTIAIIDYYSQLALKPLHKGLMSMLGSMSSDGTYSHIEVGEFAKGLTKDKSFIACADLTAATDRFPASIQKALLLELLKGKEDLANSFWNLLAERSFKVSWSGEIVTYNCGQPMGAYSSWPLFALAHHLTVSYAAYKARVPGVKRLYKLIGDDIIISDEKVWLSYKETIEALGLTINLGKTVITSKLADKSGAEVAKQLYLNGINLSPLTPGFIRSLRRPHMFNTCLGILEKRYDLSSFTVPLATLINAFFPKGKTRELVCLLITNPINGYAMDSYESCGIPNKWVENEISSDIVRSFFADIICDTMSLESKKLRICFEQEQGCPWQDRSTLTPMAMMQSYRDAYRSYIDTAEKLTRAQNASNEEFLSVVEQIEFIPSPFDAFKNREELVQRRTSSVMYKVFRQYTIEGKRLTQKDDPDRLKQNFMPDDFFF